MKITGGRNGYGAKLANIFGKKFIVEIMDGNQLYRQEWSDNMSKCNPPVITSARSENNYIRVTLYPDFAKFGISGFDQEFLSLIHRRVWDLAGCNEGLKVFLNSKRVAITSKSLMTGMFLTMS